MDLAANLVSRIQQRMTTSFDLEYITCETCGSQASRSKVSGKVVCIPCEDRKLAAETWQIEVHRKRTLPLRVFEQFSLMNPQLKKATFENYFPTNNDLYVAKSITRNYVETFDLQVPKNILLIGTPGTGKSHLAASITQEMTEKGYVCIFVSIPRLFSLIKSTYNKNAKVSEIEILGWIEQADLVVLDDIGAEYRADDTEGWAVSKLFEIIDSRMGKHTIYTTNYNSKELKERIGARNVSRMLENTEVVRMYGEDYRNRQLGGL